jgi:EAL domain-containing protein (putative c-di-GMP-specific phosphodiesterase class I)/DNA-binding CsgD family transcriptional regulator
MTMRLLVFDDDAAIGRLVVRVAAQAGLQATAVTTEAAFRQNLRDIPPQVVVLDLQLGATDGVEQLRLLAAQHYGGTVILMSGFDARVLGTAATLARNLGLTVVATLAKPVRVEALAQILQPLHAAWQLRSTESLLAAIQNNELSLDFQPIVTRRPPALKKLEALVRWEHPALGRLPPGDFLPAAETERRVIDALTEWVVGAVVDAYLVLRELGVQVPISVNISTQNLHDLTLPDRLAQRLEEAGMPAAHLCLEITETAASQDPARTMVILTRARLKGMQLAIDDFGIGYSSLKVLRQLPFSELKIDQSFVADLTTSSDSRVIVNAIIDLAANLEMECVAEGVETEAAATLLEQLNVGAMQGFLIAAPMPVEAVPAWLAIWMADNASDVTVATPEAASAGAPLGAMPLGVIADPPVLSAPQLEVMQLLTEGCSVKEIARRLDLAIAAVKVLVSRAYLVLGARNQADALTRAGLRAAGDG